MLTIKKSVSGQKKDKPNATTAIEGVVYAEVVMVIVIVWLGWQLAESLAEYNLSLCQVRKIYYHQQVL